MADEAQAQNPLLKPSAHPFGAVPFNDIRNEHFLPALEAALEQARKRLGAVRAEKETATFDNTIERLETASEEVDYISSVYSNLLHSHTNEALQALAKQIMPKLAEFSNDISLDAGLFARVSDVQAAHPQGAGLDRERARLLEKTYKFFVRNGARLSEDGKQKLREIDKQLSLLGQQFGDNVLKSTNAFEMHLADEADLAGLPGSVRETAAATAKERGKHGWVFTLQQPSYVPFMKFSERRSLRERMWKAYMGRATQGETANQALAKDIARLRHERAQLLGYATHAHFVLEERMASNPQTVKEFMGRLHAPSRRAAEKDLEEVRSFSGLTDLQPWDFAFYSERLKKTKFGIDEEALRPYFKLEDVVQGVFEHARRLYGITFKRRPDLPVYHADVEVHEVRDEKSGEFVGLFYADFFPRDSKRAGAWMTTFREQGLMGGAVQRPLVSIVCNLSKPTPTQPSLLSLDEVRTIFHEFGHALHALLSQCHFRSLAGTSVYWDFVELPSQIMENWVKEKEGLDLFARHYQTGEKIPADLVDRIKAAAKFQAGYQSLRQLSFGILDLAWHGADPSGIDDVERFERTAIEDCQLFPAVAGAIVSCGFSHIFSGGYSSGYYSYKWAEVLEADAFELFREKGIFSPEVAGRFKECILSRGGTEHPMELYKRFRGREPDPQALLRRDGLL